MKFKAHRTELQAILPIRNLFLQETNFQIENFRRKGLGCLIIQELKKACYLAGRVPAARTSIQNQASRATLIKAGMQVCGFMLKGDIKNMNG
jgi:hypothetical protein